MQTIYGEKFFAMLMDPFGQEALTRNVNKSLIAKT